MRYLRIILPVPLAFFIIWEMARAQKGDWLNNGWHGLAVFACMLVVLIHAICVSGRACDGK